MASGKSKAAVKTPGGEQGIHAKLRYETITRNTATARRDARVLCKLGEIVKAGGRIRLLPAEASDIYAFIGDCVGMGAWSRMCDILEKRNRLAATGNG